jgi:hypothetical protein
LQLIADLLAAVKLDIKRLSRSEFDRRTDKSFAMHGCLVVNRRDHFRLWHEADMARCPS